MQLTGMVIDFDNKSLSDKVIRVSFCAIIAVLLLFQILEVKLNQ